MELWEACKSFILGPAISAKNRPPSGPNKPICATNEPKDQTGKERWGRNERGRGRCKNKKTERERSGVIGYWGYRDKGWPECPAYSCPKAMVCLHLVPKFLSPKSLGTWKGRSASLCLLGKQLPPVFLGEVGGGGTEQPTA